VKTKTTTILAPINGGLESAGVLPALVPLLKCAASELTLFHVVASEEGREGALRRLRVLAGEAAGCGAVVSTKAAVGMPTDRILEEAARGRYDVVAMETHGRQGREREQLGSVAEGVLARSPRPVLLSRPTSRIMDWKRILVPLDGTAEAEEALRDAVPLARASGATIHVLRVTLSLVGEEGYRGLHFATPTADPAPYLEGVCTRLAGEGVLALPIVRQGMPTETILSVADELQAGLICVATEHVLEKDPGAPRVPVSPQLIRNSPCPVLVRNLSARVAPA
jgi:nucleotide-binding universal stress UspA family protein